MMVRNESEFKDWFLDNFKTLGYSKIIKDNKGKFPDFFMLKNNKKIGVELETLLSNFILHRHNAEKVDEVVCIIKDISLKVPTIKVEGLKYESNTKRISATIDEKTEKIIEELLKKGIYRNKSHVIEEAIKFFKKRGR